MGGWGRGTPTKQLPSSVSDILVARDWYSSPVDCWPSHNSGAGVPDSGQPALGPTSSSAVAPRAEDCKKLGTANLLAILGMPLFF